MMLNASLHSQKRAAPPTQSSFPPPPLPAPAPPRFLSLLRKEAVAPTPWQRLRSCCCQNQQQQQSTSDSPSPSPPLLSGVPKRWPKIGIALASLGFCIGPVLDGIHSNVHLQVYDNGAISIGPLQTNFVVPPLLGVFYAVVGLLQLFLDNRFARKGQLRKISSERLLLSLISLIGILELSAEMYKARTPYNIEAYVLFALAELNWYLFDSTWWGFGLAALVGVSAPLAEVPLMKFFDVWHYPKANVAVFDEGLVTWVLACYFSYVPFLANLSRWLDLQLKARSDKFSS